MTLITDVGIEAPSLRLSHLACYLRCRLRTSRYVLVAEAVGFQGAKFSGVPLTSERILLGHYKDIDRTWVFPEGPGKPVFSGRSINDVPCDRLSSGRKRTVVLAVKMEFVFLDKKATKHLTERVVTTAAYWSLREPLSHIWEELAYLPRT